ncbi:MAG: uracil-DNA glycosylase [Clostridiales bacterium]|nr:uracil-DNA glycosylase [Clostridiales bacterium]
MIDLSAKWLEFLKDEFEKTSYKNLRAFLKEEYANKTIYPNMYDIFNAFRVTPFDEVKVVLLGQDPYHNVGQAMGLSFSVPDNITPPPSLVNIYKEIESDLGITTKKSGNLTRWASQGVLLLNAVLTVRENQAGSHRNKGWEIFTDSVIKKLSDNKEHLVFLLWGNYARAKKTLIDKSKHLILECAHPSPLSAYNGFFGCKHFSKTNEFLEKNNINKINWE